MDAIVDTLYRSPLFIVHDFRCQCVHCHVSQTEYQHEFSIAYIRTGNFLFKSFKIDLDAHNGLFLISKSGYEYKVGHAHAMPDQCTIFSVSAENLEYLKTLDSSFESFALDPDRHSMLVKATPETEYLHHCIFTLLQMKRFDQLWVQQLTLTLLGKVITGIGREKRPRELSDKQKRGYLPMVEKVKTVISENISENISLSQLSDVACISPFHFTRIFKELTSFTPYAYLLRARLQSAQLQVAHTSQAITRIAFDCGFNSLEHFSAAYKSFYGISPSAERARLSVIEISNIS
jgi:AraC family transcriptional regulator